MRTILQDLQYGFRMLRKQPGFTLGVVLSLALAVGANTAIFGLIDSILVKPLAVSRPDELVALYSFNKKTAGYLPTSLPDFREYRDHNTSFSGTAAYFRMPLNLSENGSTERLAAEVVTPNYFSVLGIEAVRGRTFLPEEGPGGESQPVALIGYDLWQRGFGGDPHVVGRIINLNRQPFTVIGVVARQFKGMVLDWTQPPEVWVPMQTLALLDPSLKTALETRQARSLLVVGRLKPGRSIEQARSEVQTLVSALEQNYPHENKDIAAALLPANRANFWPSYRESIADTLTLFALVVGLLLLLACTNITNLLLERASARRKEIAVRLSLGASRSRLIRQLLTENILLALLSVSFAVLVSYGMGRVLLAFPRPFGIPLALDLTPDVRTAGFTLLLSVLAAFVFGLVPALQSTKPDLVTALKEAGPGAGAGRRRNLWRKTLVAAQVSIASVLLVSAGLFLKSLLKAYSFDPGFSVENLLLMTVDLKTQGYTEGQGQTFYKNLTERLSALPGVQVISLSLEAPISPVRATTSVFPDGGQAQSGADPLRVEYNVISPQYFQTLAMPLLSGRDFDQRDTEESQKVVIINQTLASQLWPQADPLGQRIFVRSGQSGAAVPLEVIGVAKDAKYHTVWEQPQAYLYRPLSQEYASAVNLVLRTAAAPAGVIGQVRQELRALDAELPVYGIKSGEEHLNVSLSRQRLGVALIGTFGLLALLLALVGIYSVVSYAVARQTKEIGIRVALGASPGKITAQVLRQGMVPVLIGLLVGLMLAAGVTKHFADQIPGVAAIDLPAYLLTALLLLTFSLCATYIPARRASGIHPLKALRSE